MLLLAACAGQNDDALERSERTTTTTAASSRSAKAMKVVWSVKGRYATGPLALREDDVVVALLAENGGLALVGYEGATGDELWRRASTASDVTRGVELWPLVAERTVVHLAPSEEDGGGDVVEAVDAVTGKVAWTSEASPEGFDSPPTFCTYPRNLDVCITADGTGDRAGPWELDFGTGELTLPGDRIEAFRSQPEDEPIAGRALGANLYEMDDDGDIAYIVDGKVKWRRAPRDLFGGADVSVSSGWAFAAVGDDYIVGSLGIAGKQSEGPHEMTTLQTAGIDAASGETRWLEDGTFGCGRVTRLRLLVDDDWPRIRCIWHGTADFGDPDHPEIEVEDSRIEGFDPETGKTTWTVEMGAADPLLELGGVLVRIDATRFAAKRDDGSVVGVDVAAGKALDVGPEDLGWCFEENWYPYGAPDETRLGGYFTQPCSLDGEDRPAPAKPDRGAGALTGDVFVWMDADGLHGAREASAT